MGLPNTIQNGDVPDANKLMENFTYLLDRGAGCKTGTYAELKAVAAADAATVFIAFATDIRQAVMYCGDTTVGDGGFIAIGGGALNTTEEG